MELDEPTPTVEKQSYFLEKDPSEKFDEKIVESALETLEK